MPSFLSMAEQGGWEKWRAHTAVTRTWRTQKGDQHKKHLAVGARGMLLSVVVTADAVPDCLQAGELVREINAHHPIADKGYGGDEIANFAQDRGMQGVILPRENGRQPNEHDEYMYRLQHLVESVFFHLKL